MFSVVSFGGVASTQISNISLYIFSGVETMFVNESHFYLASIYKIFNFL